MMKNVGGADRMIRIVIGVVFLALVIFGAIGSTVLNWILGILGAIALLTGLLGTCCLYLPFGLSTCKVKPESDAGDAG